jgi:hypothetical protein
MKGIRPHCTLFLAMALSAAAQPAPGDLPQALRPWVSEIEDLSGGRVILVRAYADPKRDAVLVPVAVERGEVLDRYMKDPGFRRQLGAANALSLNYEGPEGRLHYVLMNMAHSARWAGVEDGLLGHELGHAWLNARGFRSPEYARGPRACIAALSGDMVQHVLIRAEMERRGIQYRGFWVRQLEAELPGRDDDPCRRLILLTHLVDALLGFGAAEWNGLERYEAAIRETNPLVPPYAAEIAAYLKAASLSEPAGFAEAVCAVRSRAERLFAGLPSESARQLLENKETN